MNDKHQLAARVIRRGARALAAYATNELLESDPSASSRFGTDSFARWQDWFAARLEELSVAVAGLRPQQFAENVRNATAVLVSRGFPVSQLRQGFLCLRDVLARELPGEMQLTATDYLRQAVEEMKEASGHQTASLLPDTPHGRLAAAYLVAALEGDRQRAAQLILDAAQQGESVRELYLNVLVPAQAEVGRMWVVNEINVAEEHLITATTKLILSRLRPYATPRDPLGKTFVVASVMGNQHDLGLQVVADFFEMDGWRVIPLGADMPIHDLVQAVEFFEADLLGLSVSMSNQLDTLHATIAAVRNSAQARSVKILVGGPALAPSCGQFRELGADGYAAAADEAVAVGRQLVGLASGQNDLAFF